MNIGDRVEIHGMQYDGKFWGKMGTVDRISNGHIGVLVDRHKNAASGYGCYWFSSGDLKIMKEASIMLCEGYKTVGVRFLSGSNTTKVYAYACYDENVKEGDIVVVQTGHHGMSVAQVASLEYTGEVQASREIISVVDMQAYEERKARAKKKAELKKTMDKKVRELQETALYEMLAEKSPELKAILEEYNAL